MRYKAQPTLRYKRILLVKLKSPLMERYRPFEHFCPPLTLKYIESLLSRFSNVDTNIIDCHIRGYSVEDAVNASLNFKPDLLIIDINLYEFSVALDYVRLMKQSLPYLIVIPIGQDPTVRFSHYMNFLDIFDIVLCGEPEEKVINILNVLNNGENAKYLSNQFHMQFQQGKMLTVKDLDSLPFPKYSQYEIKKYHFLYPIRISKKVRCGYILSSRGCTHQCIFCSPIVRKTIGKEFRGRSAYNVVEEIEYLINAYKVDAIFFEDDNFTLSRAHVENICYEILKRKINVKWVAHARIDEVDYSFLSLMKKSGCDLLIFGIESGSERIISLLQKTNRRDWRKRALSVFNDANRLKISTNALFILGNPTETKEEMISTIQLAKKLKPDLIQIHFFTPYPGSQIYKEIRTSLTDITIDNLYHYETSVSLSCVNGSGLKKIRSLFYRKIIFSPNFIGRHIFNYGLFYLHNRNIFLQFLKMRGYFRNG